MVMTMSSGPSPARLASLFTHSVVFFRKITVLVARSAPTNRPTASCAASKISVARTDLNPVPRRTP